MTAQFVVVARATEVLDQEQPQMVGRVGEVARIERPQYRIGRDAGVETIDEATERLRTADRVVKRFRHTPIVTSLPRPTVDAMRATIEPLAEIPRLPASPGERVAAEWIAKRLGDLGWPVDLEEERGFASYAWPIGVMTAAAAVAGLTAGRGYRTVGAVVGALAAAGIADDVSNGRRFHRPLLARRRPVWNVVARCGDPDGARRVVVLGHHDAAPSGVIFDQSLEEWFVRRYPDIAAKLTANPPLWWLVVAAPTFVLLGSALGLPRLRRAGVVMSTLATAAMVDIGNRRGVPGANDNLSAVAVLAALAERFSADPLDGVQVWLVSAGAEESLQEGIRAFFRRHASELRSGETYFINLDTVASGRLVLLEGEGPIRMEWYDAQFKDLVEQCAKEQRIGVLRGLRSRNSTDGVIANRHHPTVTLVSVDDDRLLPNYHLYSDLPDACDYDCIADAAVLTESVIRALALS